jgi:uncharacterized protein with ParB-like and HNH nuclease domain
MSLQNEIELKSKEIHTENLSMSIGEIISMYNDGDIDIHPEFQRFYRWTLNQKSKLIESILLNIPIPSIFVAQREDGIWDVVDGLQRLSTIFEFVGILRDETNNKLPFLKLEETKMLPSLKEKVWEDGSINSFTDVQKRYFKRARLNFVIIQKESDDTSKYELFQRLNTGGSSLEPQEVRNCLLVMNDKEYFNRLKELSDNIDFQNCTNLSDKNLIEQYDKELVTRFLVLKDIETREASKISDLSSFLDEQIIEFFKKTEDSQWEDVKKLFTNTFKLLNETVQDNAFKRFNLEQDKFYGGFIVSAYEMVAIGVANNIDFYLSNPSKVEEKIKLCWKKIQDDRINWKGYSASGRLPKTLNIGKEIFHES